MNRTIGGIPLWGWVAALAVGIGGFWLIRKRSTSGTSPSTTGRTGSPNQFTQAQEVQDFQIFSALTGAQQASDFNMVSELAGIFGGGSSTGTTGTGSGSVTGGGSSSGTTSVPSPTNTGTTAPTTVPASASQTFTQSPAPAGGGQQPVSSLPGYGAGLAQLLAANPGLTASEVAPPGAPVPTYNGVPL